MSPYTLRAMRRASDDTIVPTVHESSIFAAADDAAVSKARALDLDLGAIDANVVYLSLPGSGVIWSLDVPRLIEAD